MPDSAWASAARASSSCALAFCRLANLAGLKAAGGLGMLVEQGALAFELWTGAAAPRDVMLRAAQAALG